MQLKNNVHYLMNIRELKYCVFAKELGISSNTLWSIANKDMYDPHLSVLIKISEYFDIGVDDLVYRDLNKEKIRNGGINL